MKTLLAGCSLSDWCGFGAPVARDNLPPMPMIGNHDDPRCWYNIVKNNLDLDLINVSYGGYSNEEIMRQAIKHVVLDRFDLVLIQFTSTQRKWFFRADDPFDFVLAHGTNSQNIKEKEMSDFFRVYFNNELVETEKILSSFILVQQYLKEKGIPLIAINGSNFGKQIISLRQDAEKFCRTMISPQAWANNGLQYANELERLAKLIDIENFLALDKSLGELQVDVAEDNMHPGQQSNLLYASLVENKIRNINR